MADTQLQQLVINELTKAQYEGLTPEPNQLYMVTDEDYLEPSDIATSITAASTNAQVAGAKAVYDAIQSGGTSDPNAVHYTAETKTTEEKAQARSNIGAGTSNLTIGTTASTAAAGNHTHNYAGSSSAGGAATSANKVNAALTFSNGGSGAASGTTFDGSTARTISYNSIGAAASSHSHAFGDLTSRPSYAGSAMTGSTAIPEVKTATWDGKSVVSGVASGGNWTSITINGTTKSIPAGGSGGTTKYLHSIVLTNAHSNGTECISFNILNTTSTSYTTIAGIAGALTASKKYACTGYTHGTSIEIDCTTYEFNLIPVYLLKDGSNLSIHAYTSDASDDGCGHSVEWTWSISDWTVSDTVM